MVTADHPNGEVTAYYGDATSCVKQILDKADYQFGTTRPDGAKWAKSPQSTVIFDRTVPPLTVYNLPSPPAPWVANKVYAVNQTVMSPLPFGPGMDIFVCIVGGTSASSGNGPSDNGVVTDGTVKWLYVGGNYGG